MAPRSWTETRLSQGISCGLSRCDEDSARLKLTYNIQRQEEITEEVEVILLSADMLHETGQVG